MSLYPAEHTEELKTWLTSELEPICDADPDVLADYVLALLKHPGGEAELRSMLSEQLSDFLGDQTRVFVENVFTGLHAKIYLPVDARGGPANVAAAAPAPAVEEVKPTSATAAVGTKRRADDDGDQQMVPAGPKSQRTAFGSNASSAAASLPPNPALQGLRMPIGPAPRGFQIGAGGNGMNMGGLRGGPGRGGQGGRTYIPPEMCRDYHTKGYCERGDGCKYIHSSDTITGGMGMNGFQGMVGMPGMMGPGANQRPAPFGPNGGLGSPFGARGPGGGASPGVNGSGRSEPPSLAARLSMASQQPSIPASMGPGSGPPMYPGGGPGFGMPGMPGFGMPNPMAMMQHQQQQQHRFMQQQQGPQQQQQQQSQLRNPQFSNGSGNGEPGGRGGFRGGRGGGPNRGNMGHFARARKSNTTLVIENVPVEHLELVKINDYFKRFGTITNIQVDVAGQKALLSYSSPEEAKAAHSSPESVFGNRFIKVFFQRLKEESSPKPQFSAGGPSPQQRPPPTQIFGGARSNTYVAPLSSTSQAEASARTSAIAERERLSEEQSAAQYALDLLRGESKTVFSRVSAPGASDEVKNEGMKRFMELEKEIKTATERVKAAVAALEAAPKIPPGPTLPAVGSGSSSSAVDPAKREEMERKRLDRELDLHAQTASGKETPEELRAKLAKLQEEAASIGLDANGQPIAGATTFRGGPRGGYRGGFRGAPRGSFRGRGRGGSSMTFFNLDNRTTKVLVAPADGESWDAAQTEKAKAWAKSFGEVQDLSDESSGFTATFKTRAVAEQALRSGASIPDVGSAKLSWVQPTSSAPSAGGATAAPGAGDESAANGNGSVAAGAGGGGGGTDHAMDGDDDLALYES